MLASSTLGRIGIWSMELRFGTGEASLTAAAELEDLGYGTLWIPGGVGGNITADLDRLLAATRRIVIATGIINIWKHEPEDIAKWFTGLANAQQSRLMLGVGISHGPLIGEAWQRPLAVMRSWIGRATAAGLPSENLCVAALRPGMLKLSGELTAGAHPYLVTPDHSAEARKILGPRKLLATEQGVILETDPAKSRELALTTFTHYRRLPNYRNSWVHQGFTEKEIENADERLIDGLFAIGTVDVVGARVDAHLAAGADHVCMQLIHPGGMDASVALQGWRELAKLTKTIDLLRR
jgi:probable F420-dependent oxidoreductase